MNHKESQDLMFDIVTEKSVLKQDVFNNIILNFKILKQVLKEIFGKTPYILRKTSTQKQLVIEKTFPSNMKIKDFNKQFNSHLPDKGVETLSQLIVQELGHIPEKGELISDISPEMNILNFS